ncbi:hypothetical protein Hdeb2414_s0001g00027081 [Helianthus debilis subsp. tardiflorus]
MSRTLETDKDNEVSPRSETSEYRIRSSSPAAPAKFRQDSLRTDGLQVSGLSSPATTNALIAVVVSRWFRGLQVSGLSSLVTHINLRITIKHTQESNKQTNTAFSTLIVSFGH